MREWLERRDCRNNREEQGKNGGAELGRVLLRRWLLPVLQLLVAPLVLLSSMPSIAADREAPEAEERVYEALRAGQRHTAEQAYEVPAQPTVFLTFDDGPGVHTADVLDILRDEQVKATFFVLGEHVERHPELVRRIDREGHAIGNHTFDHVYDTLYGSFGSFWEQVLRTEAALEAAASVRTRLLRAPGGTYTNFDASYFYYLEQAGYVVNDWNVDSGDSRRKGVPAAEIVKGATSLTSTKKTPNQIVVLMHDSSGHGETVKALPAVIRFYKDNGYVFAPLSPNIRPIQSPLGKLKWKRGSDYAEHAVWAEQARQHAARWEAEAVGGKSGSGFPGKELLVTGTGDASSAPATVMPPLRLHMGDRTIELESGAYSFRNDRHYVPLRALVEALGGSVEWEETSRRATARHGLHQAVYDLPNGSIAFASPGRSDGLIVMAEIGLIDGRLMVPLRQAVELLGGEVSDYRLDDRSRDVYIAGGDGYEPTPYRQREGAAKLSATIS